MLAVGPDKIICGGIVYLQVPLWVCSFTVFTFYDPPLARVCHMLFKVFPFHGHKTMFVGTINNFEQANSQVSLFKTATNVRIKRVIAFQTNKGEGVLVSTSLGKIR